MAKGIQGLVKSILQRIPGTRDDDAFLYCEVLKWRKFNPLTELSHDLLKKIHHGELPSMVVVVRCRALLQQNDASLRGKLWNKRHQLSENFKQELRKEPTSEA